MKLGYARVSTDQQNTARQLAELQAAGVEPENIITDKTSGTDKNRPGLTELLIKVRQGDYVITSSMDRLARSQTDLDTIIENINKKGGTVHILKGDIVCTPEGATPTDNLIVKMMGLFAEFERNLSRERQAEGISAAKQRGAYKGSKPTISRTEVTELVEAGFNNSQIAQKMKVHRSSIIRIKKELKRNAKPVLQVDN